MTHFEILISILIDEVPVRTIAALRSRSYHHLIIYKTINCYTTTELSERITIENGRYTLRLSMVCPWKEAFYKVRHIVASVVQLPLQCLFSSTSTRVLCYNCGTLHRQPETCCQRILCSVPLDCFDSYNALTCTKWFLSTFTALGMNDTSRPTHLQSKHPRASVGESLERMVLTWKERLLSLLGKSLDIRIVYSEYALSL